MQTNHTIMNNLEKIRVHIAPIGFEIDRIVIPAKKMKADKIWLLQHNKPDKEVAKLYVEKISKELKKHKIQVSFAEADRKDVFKVLKAVKDIFENEHKNNLYVNLSSGSKIQAIACMMACMMFNEFHAIPYYAEPENYLSTHGKPQSNGVRELIELPRYEIRKPKQELIQALKIIKDHNNKITKKEMAKLAEENNLIVVKAREENLDQARFASLEANIIQPLSQEWKFVKIEKIGRNRWIKITREGLDAAEFLI